MIQPPGWDGVAFSERSDGDLRNDRRARNAASDSIGATRDWAELHQVHGSDVVRVDRPGVADEADALWTTERGLPLAVFTADCFGVVLQGEDAVGVAHAGWRGAAAGVVGELRSEMQVAGHRPVRAGIGPGIGPCCFEVGPEVAERFDNVAATTWGAVSVDLRAAIGNQLDGLVTWVADACTLHEGRWFSHRSDGTTRRMAALGWLP